MMTIKEAQEMDLSAYLRSLGLMPQRISGNSYWFYSPFRDEQKPSFMINRTMNFWYDFGTGHGRNVIDFGVLYFQCSVGDFLRRLDSQSAGITKRTETTFNKPEQSNFTSTIELISTSKTTSLTLLNYLQKRRIHPAVSNEYLEEITYQNGGKIYSALGFKNDSGGYELRSENFKGSSSPKDIRFIDCSSTELTVFEGLFDFLSYLSMYYKKEPLKRNFLVLNSTSFFEKSMPKILEHEIVYLYLDNDATGQKCSQLALDLNSKKFIDESVLYRNYKDLNDWLVQ